MSVQIETVLTSGLFTIIVAILTIVTTLITGRRQFNLDQQKFRDEQANKQKELQRALEQFKHEQQEWITNLKTTYETEIFKTRMASYPKAFEIIGKLSHGARESLNPEKAHEVAYQLNEWFYSIGGMCADPSTRGALLLLRQACLNWEKPENRPRDFYQWRNYSLLLLRNDLGIQGLETYEFEKTANLITKVKDEVAKATSFELPK